MRILITGSRDWPYPQAVYHELAAVVGDKWDETVIVHGACPTGADHFAEIFASSKDCGIERHPADWDLHGKAAGPFRNQDMVDLGADLCLAFRFGGSRGTSDCIRRAMKAGIPCRVVELAITELT